jgi:hypothetical protein
MKSADEQHLLLPPTLLVNRLMSYGMLTMTGKSESLACFPLLSCFLERQDVDVYMKASCDCARWVASGMEVLREEKERCEKERRGGTDKREEKGRRWEKRTERRERDGVEPSLDAAAEIIFVDVVAILAVAEERRKSVE